jgi:hypothetical protein
MKINILVCLAICFNTSFVLSQHAFKDTSKRYGLHLGLNYGAGIVTTYHTAIVTFGLCYKVKKSRIEMGYRYIFY